MTSVLLDAKLAPPPWRPGSRSRMDLVERVRTDDRQVVVVTAPAGYGKSTFLRQWAEREDRPVAWVSLETTDDDEVVVLDYVATALERVGALAARGAVAVSPEPGGFRAVALTRLAEGLWRTARPSVLMIDDVDQVRSTATIDALSWLSEHLPPTVRLAVASRERVPLPLARLRARGQLLEVGTRSLAMSPNEARDVLELAGVRATDEQVTAIARRTEGWPAGIYLIALSLRAGGHADMIMSEPGVTGLGPAADRAADRHVAEFLRTEVLGRASSEQRAFLVLTSPLDRFDARLCDHVLEGTGSAGMLDELERTNAFLVRLDDRSQWFRYHHLFRQMLLTELRRQDPQAEARVLRRAADWCATHDDPDAAIEYAHLAGDDDLVASLLVTNAMRSYRLGRLTTLDRWFGWFDADLLARTPSLAILGAWIWALSGRTSRAERWEDAALPHLGDLDPVTRARFAAFRAVTGRMDRAAQVEESRVAMAGIPRGDAWYATAFLGGGVQQLLAGDAAAADVLLAHAIDAGLEDGGIPATTTALALRAHLAMLRSDWEHAEELTRRARSLISEYGLEGYTTSALSFVAGARVALHHGAHVVARADIAHVQRIRPMLTAAIPFLATRVRLDLAGVYLTLGEVAGARLMLSEASDVVAARPGVAPLLAELTTLRARVGGMRGGGSRLATLTTAELRLLGYLPSHLSFREIAERLYVSVNTVKTQAVSIYAKLDVSSRSAAIEAAVGAGLLDASVTRFPSPSSDPVPDPVAGSPRA